MTFTHHALETNHFFIQHLLSIYGHFIWLPGSATHVQYKFLPKPSQFTLSTILLTCRNTMIMYNTSKAEFGKLHSGV